MRAPPFEGRTSFSASTPPGGGRGGKQLPGGLDRLRALRRPEHDEPSGEGRRRRGGARTRGAVRRRRADGARPGARTRDAGARRRSRRRSVRPRSSARSGCRSRWSSAEPGDAAQRKLLRSVFMKGLAAADRREPRGGRCGGLRGVAARRTSQRRSSRPTQRSSTASSRAAAAMPSVAWRRWRRPASCSASSASSRASPRVLRHCSPSLRVGRRGSRPGDRRRAMTPSARGARARSAARFDMHIHIAPDVVPRRVDDVTLARRFAELGLAGFVLKSHYVSTAERAAVVARRRPGRRGARARSRSTARSAG